MTLMNDYNNTTLSRIIRTALLATMTVGMSPFLSIAQDIVYQVRPGKSPARVRGKIEQVSPQEVTVATDTGTQKISADQIVRIVYDNQPILLTRSRERFLDGRYADCLEELNKLKEDPSGQKWQAESDYLRAAVNAELSLSGGDVTAQNAGTQINQFLRTHPESYLKFPAMERLGKLLFAFGRMKNASQSFGQLAQSGWPIYQLTGPYWQGMSEREQGNLDEAIRFFEQTAASETEKKESETWKLMAACQVARCRGEAGNADAAIASLEKIVKEQSPDNDRLFATAFNSLGSVYLKQNRLKEARTEFLKTELLYPTATDEHAEALYHLTKIWAQLNENDRAIRTRETLKNLYPNSWWATRD